MKKKLLSVFAAMFVTANILSLIPVQNAYADPVTDAITVIVSCKGKNGPFQDGSQCDLYEKCIYETGNPPGCPTIKRLNPTVSALSGSTLEGCRRTMSHEQCTAAFVKCLQSKLDDGGGGLDPDNDIPFAETDKCKAEIAKGTGANTDDPKKDEGKEDKPSCVIDGIGWILCPVLTFISLIVDNAYKVVADLLDVEPLLTTGESAGVYQAWSIMRNFANVAFVIAFLVIIFSQVSNIGITNYGIKKMLPRLVVAAILVNVSYWVCAIAVDISNILGASFGDLFSSIEGSVKTDKAGTFSGDGGWAFITGSILAGTIGAAVIYVSLSALVPALVTVLFTIVVTFIVLALRQALIILLIVIAPLAFVAYLLPNTESLFNKWRALLQTLLLMYPIIALIFGASALASTIVMHSAQGDYKIAIQIMGGLIAVIPLAITPVILKTAGGVLNRFAGIVNDKSKGIHDRARNGAAGYMQNRKVLNETKALRNGRYRPGQSFYRMRAKRKAVLASRESTLKDTTKGFISREAQLGETPGDNVFAEQMAGGGRFTKGDETVKAAVIAGAISQEKQALMDDVRNMEALVRVKFANNPEQALEEALASGNQLQALAAQNVLFQSGSGGISRFRNTVEKSERAAAEASANGDDQAQKNLSGVAAALKTNIQENHGKWVKEKGADVTAWANAKPDESGKTPTLSESAAGDLNANELAGQHSGSLAKMAKQGKISQEKALSVLNDKRVSANLDDAKRTILENAAGYTKADVDRAHSDQIDKAHEQANQLNIKHDQDAAYRTYENNGNIRR